MWDLITKCVMREDKRSEGEVECGHVGDSASITSLDVIFY